MTARPGLGAMGVAVALPLALASCGSAPAEPRQMESDAELQALKDREFANSPDIQLPELRKRLNALGVADRSISETSEEHGVAIFILSLDDATFDRLNKAALARLILDSRYRFQVKDAAHTTKLAHFSGAEDARRRKASALHYLTVNKEIDRFPRYKEGMPMIGYAKALEHYCGYQPNEALNVIDGRWLEYRNRMVDKAVEDRDNREHARASFDCVVRIIYATELQPHFIGNRSLSGTTKI